MLQQHLGPARLADIGLRLAMLLHSQLVVVPNDDGFAKSALCWPSCGWAMVVQKLHGTLTTYQSSAQLFGSCTPHCLQKLFHPQ